MKADSRTLLIAGLPEIEEEAARRSSYKLNTRFPDTGPYRRELYQKHVEFLTAGATYRERGMLAANRIGKTDTGAFETALHLTGRYPDWWKGRRFDEPVSWWVGGDTSTTVRDIPQQKLMGSLGAWGTGFLPAHLIEKTTMKQGVAGAIDTVSVRHTSGKTSVVHFKSYDQRRQSFQGTAQHGIWLDEEPPLDIYTECLLRTAQTGDFLGGIIFLTFTPLNGYTPLVVRFLSTEGRACESRFVITETWDDVAHLSEEEKAELLEAIPPNQRGPRTRGIPELGSGAIYPIPESDIVVPNFAIPEHWPRGYGLDVGWKKTAAVWAAHDQNSDTLYLYDVHYQGEAEPLVHAAEIQRRGKWIPGRIDPAANGRSQVDGRRLLSIYLELGLTLVPAPNALDSGIYEVRMRLSTGRLKVFASLEPWLEEFRLYRRDENGKVVKGHDHLMDATRYLVLSGVNWLKPVPPKDGRLRTRYVRPNFGPHGWMA